MKRNIRNLVVIVIIIVVAPFIMAAMALAAEPIPHGIRGQYAFTAGGTVLTAPLGFETNLRPKGPPGAYIYQTFSVEGVYRFERDGTGSFEALNHSAILPFTMPNPNPPPPTITIPSSAASANVKFSFHYTVTEDRKITITADPGTYSSESKYGPSAGSTSRIDGMARMGFISPDGKMIILTGGAPSVMSFVAPFGNMPPTSQMILHSNAVLFYQHD
jgi:hypothetical protein